MIVAELERKIHPVNASVAARLDAVAQILEQQDANPFRVQAYREGAATVRRLDQSVETLFEREGIPGLENLPAIGPVLAQGIRDIIITGRLPMLDRLLGEGDPVTVLKSVPGIGAATAERLHTQLGIGTLEELEMAAHDGRLARVRGFGPKRVAGIRDVLATRLGRLRAPVHLEPKTRPPVSELLDVDREYREKSDRGKLHLIAPRRFNPSAKAWLPVLHTHRGERHYTALFSNTARAHRLRKTRDWVVLYFDHGSTDAQATVITAGHGPLRGKRIVRGRETECEGFYGALDNQADRAVWRRSED